MVFVKSLTSVIDLVPYPRFMTMVIALKQFRVTEVTWWTCNISLRPFPKLIPVQDGLKENQGTSPNVLQICLYCASSGPLQLRMRILVATVFAIAAAVKADTNTYTN